MPPSSFLTPSFVTYVPRTRRKAHTRRSSGLSASSRSVSCRPRFSLTFPDGDGLIHLFWLSAQYPKQFLCRSHCFPQCLNLPPQRTVPQARLAKREWRAIGAMPNCSLPNNSAWLFSSDCLDEVFK